jgi:hypothetical protein
VSLLHAIEVHIREAVDASIDVLAAGRERQDGAQEAIGRPGLRGADAGSASAATTRSRPIRRGACRWAFRFDLVKLSPGGPGSPSGRQGYGEPERPAPVAL